MTVVKGSRQVRSVVVPYRPGRQLLVALVLIGCFIVVGFGGYRYGSAGIENRFDQLQQERDLLRSQLATTQTELQNTTQQFANIEMGAEIDRKAIDDIREVVRQQKQEIASLSEEISFYKGLMAPTDRERGLSIRSWELYPTNNPRRFQYKLTVQQLATKHTLMTGRVNISLTGRQGEILQTFPLNILSEQVDSENIRLRFKYFQNVEGELLLPLGFEPSSIDIEAKAEKPEPAQVEKHYSWIVQS